MTKYDRLFMVHGRECFYYFNSNSSLLLLQLFIYKYLSYRRETAP